jgi:hypothetical protein
MVVKMHSEFLWKWFSMYGDGWKWIVSWKNDLMRFWDWRVVEGEWRGGYGDH